MSTGGTDDQRPEVDEDVTSDPALDEGSSSDWSSEGGAATEGPATDTDDSEDRPAEDD